MTIEVKARALADWVACEYNDNAECEYAEMMARPCRAAVLWIELQGDLTDADGYEPYDLQAYVDLAVDDLVIEVDGKELPVHMHGFEALYCGWEEGDYDWLYAECLSLAEVNGYERT